MLEKNEINISRRLLFVESDTSTIVPLGNIKPFTSYQSLLKRRNQSLQECLNLKPDLKKEWLIAQNQIEQKLLSAMIPVNKKEKALEKAVCLKMKFVDMVLTLSLVLLFTQM